MNESKWRETTKFVGFFAKRDVTKLPIGAMILGSKNIRIGDDDQLEPRNGSDYLGQITAATSGKTLHSFVRRDESEVLMATGGAVLDFYHPTVGSFVNLANGFTTGQVFGFEDFTVNDDNVDYVYFCNSYEPYARWNGVYDVLDGDYSGGETEVAIVGEVLDDEKSYEGTASSATDTTITMPAGTWTDDVYNSLYVHITDGALAGSISKISDTTATVLTFDAITGLNGTTPAFEIRRMRFDDSNKKLRVGTTDVTYTGFDDINTFNGVSSMPAASDGDSLAQAIEEFKGAPRGNILNSLNQRMFVAGIRSSGEIDSTQPSSASIYYSNIGDASDFSFSSPRSADEGGIIDIPKGGGGITFINDVEDVLYCGKRNCVHTLTFTTDGNDLPVLKPLIGAKNVGGLSQISTVKTDSDIFYISPDGTIRSVKRPEVTDFARPVQVSDEIKLFVKDRTFTASSGVYWNNRLYFSCVESDGNTAVLVYSFEKQAWNAPYYGWDVADWAVYEGNLYYISSVDGKVYQAEVDDRYDDNGFEYECVARLAYDNAGAMENVKTHSLLFIDGYISEITDITVTDRYNYLGGSGSKEGHILGTEDQYIVASPEYMSLGMDALGLNPLGVQDSGEEVPVDNNRFKIFFTMTEFKYFEHSVEFSTKSVGAKWSIVGFGTNMTMVPVRMNKLDKKMV